MNDSARPHGTSPLGPARLRTSLAGLELRNPVLLAAGTAGTLDEIADVLDPGLLGGIVTKSITARARPGNPTWRVWPLDVGMLNAIGLANVGLETFREHVLPRAAGVPCAVIGSIAGFSVDDYVKVAAVLDDADAIEAVELNVSCPNVHGGTEFGADPQALGDLIRAVRPVLARTRLVVKLSPIAVGKPGIVDIARVCIEGGAVPSGPNQRPGVDALALANTVPAMAIDVVARRPVLANTTGGLSGPAVHPIALKLVHDVWRGIARDTGTALVGIGGVRTWREAAAFILAGASAVEVGTALFADPRTPVRIVKGLDRWVRAQGVGTVAELLGALREPETIP